MAVSGIQDEDVGRRDGLREVVGEAGDAGWVGDVERKDFDGLSFRAQVEIFHELFSAGFPLFDIADGENYRAAFQSQELACCFEAEAGTGAGYDCGLALQIDVGGKWVDFWLKKRHFRSMGQKPSKVQDYVDLNEHS